MNSIISQCCYLILIVNALSFIYMIRRSQTRRTLGAQQYRISLQFSTAIFFTYKAYNNESYLVALSPRTIISRHIHILLSPNSLYFFLNVLSRLLAPVLWFLQKISLIILIQKNIFKPLYIIIQKLLEISIDSIFKVSLSPYHDYE